MPLNRKDQQIIEHLIDYCAEVRLALVHRTRNNWTRSTQDEFSAARRRSEA